MKEVNIMLTLVFSVLAIGFLVGLVTGFVCLCIDRHRKRNSRVLHIDGVTLEYDCSPQGIYETIRAVIDGR
jgi:hypothetical protein